VLDSVRVARKYKECDRSHKVDPVTAQPHDIEVKL
jgi:hypothetical protein